MPIDAGARVALSLQSLLVVESVLTSDELSALETAVRRSSRSLAGGERPEPRPQPVALIGEERVGATVRPTCLRLANRFVQVAPILLARAHGVNLDLHVADVVTCPGSELREALAGSWLGAVDIPSREGSILVSVSGPIISRLAEQLLGGPKEIPEEAVTPNPSLASIGVFARPGAMLVRSLGRVLLEEQNVASRIRESKQVDERKNQLMEASVLLRTEISVQAPAPGKIVFIAKPETFVEPPSPPKAAPVPGDAVDLVLAEVPAEILVELGRAKISVSELARLKPGTIITLNQTTDSLLSVQVQGTVKAYGHPVVSRGAMAVEIAVLRHGGEK